MESLIIGPTGGRTLWELIKEKLGFNAVINSLTSQVTLKANATQPAWQTISLLAGSSGAPLFDVYNPSFMKDTLGFVHLRGMITKPDGSQFVAGLLPAGFRPAKELSFISGTITGIHSSITIKSDGTIILQSNSNGVDGNPYYLENCQPFQAEG